MGILPVSGSIQLAYSSYSFPTALRCSYPDPRGIDVILHVFTSSIWIHDWLWSQISIQRDKSHFKKSNRFC
jgi:hypothetical protein